MSAGQLQETSDSSIAKTSESEAIMKVLTAVDEATLPQFVKSHTPLIRGAGSPMLDFIRTWDANRVVITKEIAAGETATAEGGLAGGVGEQEKKPPSTSATAHDGVAVSMAAKPRKDAQQQRTRKLSKNASAALSRAVPTEVSVRYPADTMPMCNGAGGVGAPLSLAKRLAATPEVAAAAATLAAATTGSSDPSRRALELRLVRAQIPRHLLHVGSAAVMHTIENNLSDVVLRPQREREPVFVRWNWVQATAYVEAMNDSEKCANGDSCYGMMLPVTHPAGSFVFRAWMSPVTQSGPTGNTGKASTQCYMCILRYINLRKDLERSEKSSRVVITSPFEYLINVPGEYTDAAFRSPDDSSGKRSTLPIRCISLCSLIPDYIVENGVSKRRFRESPELQYCDGSRLVYSAPFVRPSSFVEAQIAPLTNERILLIFIFRDLADRYKKWLNRDLPEWTKILRLVFMPIEEALVHLCDAEWTREWMPKDFDQNPDYIFTHFDLVTRVGVPADRRPMVNGHSLYYLLHLRINATLMLEKRGFAQFQADLGRASTKGRARATAADAPPADDVPKKSRLPASVDITTAETRCPLEWISREDIKTALADEIAAKRTQLRRFLLSHEPMTDFIAEQLRNIDLRGRVDDDYLLSAEVFPVIKPDPAAYVGPLYPEDRSRIEYIERPRVVHRPSAGQLACLFIERWCTRKLDALETLNNPPILSDEAGARLAWSFAGPPNELSYRGGRSDSLSPIRLDVGDEVSIPIEYLLGDFRATHWWLSREASDEFVGGPFHRLIPRLMKTWNYQLYHRIAAEALKNGTWRSPQDATKSYTLLATLLLRVHGITALMRTLQIAYNTRSVGLDAEIFEPIESGNVSLFSELASVAPEDIFNYVPSEEIRVRYTSDEARHARDSQLALQECIYHLFKVLSSHLPLAYSMVVHCTDERGCGPTDAMLQNPELSKTFTVSDGKSVPTLYELAYPRCDLVMCEDNTPDYSVRESLLKFISERPSADPLLEAQEKAAPARCHPRDFEKRIREMMKDNASARNYYLQALYCTLIGGYRTARLRPRFARMLELYSVFHAPEQSKTDGPDVIDRMCSGAKHISVCAMRENMMMHIRNNVGYHAAVNLRFGEGGKDYGNFERVWLRNSADEVRRLLDLGWGFEAISNEVKESQGRTKPFVYRRTRTDVLKEIWSRLKESKCDYIVENYMRMDRFEWPNLLKLEREDLRKLFDLVAHTDPHSPEFDYGAVLLSIGLSEESLEIIEQIEANFTQFGASTAVDEKLRQMDQAQHLIASAFFFMMRAHAAVRSTKLSDKITSMQKLAIARRMRAGPEDSLPENAHKIYFCSALGCGKRKTVLSCEGGLSYLGNSDVSHDKEQGADVCRPRKTSKGGYSLAARRQRSKREESALVGPAQYEPGVLSKAGLERDSKTLATARRAFQKARTTLDEKSEELIRTGKCTADNLLENDKVKHWIEKLKRARQDVEKAVRKEANQYVRTMFNLPCEDGVMIGYNLLGCVVERTLSKDRSESYTICPCCGCAMLFKLNLVNCGSFSCGVCDARLRDDLHRPSCIACGLMFLTTNPEKRAKKKTSAATAVVSGAPGAIDASQAPNSSVSSRVIPLSQQLDPYGHAIALRQQQIPITAQAAIDAVTSGLLETTSVASASKKRRPDASNQSYVVKDSSNAAEDAIVRSKRGARSGRSLDKIGTDEVYSYRLFNTDQGEFQRAYLCGVCHSNRSWLRTIEPMCTIHDFVKLVHGSVLRSEEASRRLRLGIYADSDAPVKGVAEPTMISEAAEQLEKARAAVRRVEEAMAPRDEDEKLEDKEADEEEEERINAEAAQEALTLPAPAANPSLPKAPAKSPAPARKKAPKKQQDNARSRIMKKLKQSGIVRPIEY